VDFPRVDFFLLAGFLAVFFFEEDFLAAISTTNKISVDFDI